MTLTVKIEREKCCGYGICAEICPSVYKLDEAGFVYIDSDQVSAADEEAAIEGAEACPELAIEVVRG
ncbi:MAG: ferredoxin [Frankiales bacterium]|nr:ferredoxin [Frankiales bacterium]